jgi:hypothetical protein
MRSRRGRQAYFLVLNDGTMQQVETVLRTATDFWRMELESESLPSAFA